MAKAKKERRFLPMMKSVFRDTAKSIERNNLMSMASILSVMAALIILGVFILFTVNVTHITENIESSMEMKVFLQNGYTEKQRDTIEQALMDNDMVTGVSFESEDEALNKFSDSLEEYSGMLKGYDENNNPLAASFIVKIDDPSHFTEVKSFAESLTDDGVDYVKYGEEFLNVMIEISDFSRTLSAIVMIILTIISLFVIYNTIKLTCFSKRREINVMKYVGATNWYIRMPFILEGVFLGCIGAIVAILLLRVGYLYALAYVQNSVFIPMDGDLIAPNQIIGPVFLFSLIYGIVVGAFGSLFSIRKFLKV